MAQKHEAFDDVQLVDLAEWNLPFMDEPHHPRLRRYEHQHTRDWSAKIDQADAFVIVLPEYNYGYTAPLKNAIDYLHHEWAYKPVGLVSYGGVAAGARAAQMIKQVLTTLKMMPVPEAVQIPFVAQFLDDDRTIRPNTIMWAASVAAARGGEYEGEVAANVHRDVDLGEDQAALAERLGQRREPGGPSRLTMTMSCGGGHCGSNRSAIQVVMPQTRQKHNRHPQRAASTTDGAAARARDGRARRRTPGRRAVPGTSPMRRLRAGAALLRSP